MTIAKTIGGLFVFGLLAAAGCAVEQADTAEQIVDDGEEQVDELSAKSTPKPICKYAGNAKKEGWYWSNNNKLIRKEACKGASVACSAIGSKSEGFVRADTGEFLAWGACGKALRVSADGRPCGGSIGYGCEYQHACFGMPKDKVGGSGVCHDLGWCATTQDCAATMPQLAPPGYYACESNQCVRKVATAGLGDNCGGFANLKCADGLVCTDASNKPAPSGTCKPSGAGLGEICGGFANVSCQAGLVCTDASNKPAPTGTCKRKASKEGELCGGIAGLQCDDALYCAFGEGACMSPDASGVCRQKFIGLSCSPPNPQIDNRVCDCNGNTQVDRCHAKAANVSIAHVGACQ